MSVFCWFIFFISSNLLNVSSFIVSIFCSIIWTLFPNWLDSLTETYNFFTILCRNSNYFLFVSFSFLTSLIFKSYLFIPSWNYSILSSMTFLLAVSIWKLSNFKHGSNLSYLTMISSTYLRRLAFSYLTSPDSLMSFITGIWRAEDWSTDCCSALNCIRSNFGISGALLSLSLLIWSSCCSFDSSSNNYRIEDFLVFAGFCLSGNGNYFSCESYCSII